jgi:hypothetical protein
MKNDYTEEQERFSVDLILLIAKHREFLTPPETSKLLIDGASMILDFMRQQLDKK